MIYELMKYHFETHRYPGISFDVNQKVTPHEKVMIRKVEELQVALIDFKIKMSASLARIRIEKKASGSTFKEMVENILPDDVRMKENVAGIFILLLHFLTEQRK